MDVIAFHLMRKTAFHGQSVRNYKKDLKLFPCQTIKNVFVYKHELVMEYPLPAYFFFFRKNLWFLFIRQLCSFLNGDLLTIVKHLNNRWWVVQHSCLNDTTNLITHTRRHLDRENVLIRLKYIQMCFVISFNACFIFFTIVKKI